MRTIWLIPFPFSGARVNTKFQFGYVSLDIISSTVMDQGEYTVEVRSASGSAHSTAKLMINPRKEMEPDYTRSEMMQQVEMKQVKQVSSHDLGEEVAVHDRTSFLYRVVNLVS